MKEATIKLASNNQKITKIKAMGERLGAISTYVQILEWPISSTKSSQPNLAMAWHGVSHEGGCLEL